MDCISKFNNETILFNYLSQTLKQFHTALTKSLPFILLETLYMLLYAINIKQCLWRSVLSLCYLEFHSESLHLKSSVCITKGEILQIRNWQWKCHRWFSKAIKKYMKSASCQVQNSALEEKMWKGDRQNMTWWYTTQKIWGENQISYQSKDFWNTSVEKKSAIKSWQRVFLHS